MSKRAEELAREITPCPCCTGDYSGVIAALPQYGQEVRRRDAEVAHAMDSNRYGAITAAISKEPLP